MKRSFWQLAESHPEVPLVHDCAGWHTAGDLLQRSRRWGQWLSERGLEPGGWLWIAAAASFDVVALVMAALEGGLRISVLPSLAGLEEEFERHPSALLLDEPALARAGPSVASLPGSPGPPPPPRRRAGQRVFFRSGSSARSGSSVRSKPVLRPLSERPPEFLCKLAAQHLNAVCGVSPDEGLRHLVVSPLGYSASLLWASDHLLLGHSVVLAEGVRAAEMLDLIERHRVVSTLLVPTHLYRLLALPEEVRASRDLSSLRYVVHTGAPCGRKVKQQMLDWWGPVLYEVYGAAEGAGTRVGPQEWLERPGTVGRTYGRVRLQRPDGSLCQPGEVGEVWLRSGREFVPVGDRGWMDAEDYLFLQGRCDDIIVSGGVKICPAEVESVLAEHPGVLDAVVGARPDPEWGQRLQAWLELAPGQNWPTVRDQLEQLCARRLPPGHQPRVWEVVAELPRLPSGKPDRIALHSSQGSASSE